MRSDRRSEPLKAPYSAPVLVEYGNLVNLTTAKSVGTVDAGTKKTAGT